VEVELVGEAPAGLEVAVQALDDALGLRIACLAEGPVDAQLTPEGGTVTIGRR
jgi:hypothetical protein